MLNEDHKVKKIVAKISDNDLKIIKAYIKGAVYCYTKLRPDEYFGFIDLFGGANTNWEGTPLQALYEWHYANRQADAEKMAGKDAGYLLLSIIVEDSTRTYETNTGFYRTYRKLL